MVIIMIYIFRAQSMIHNSLYVCYTMLVEWVLNFTVLIILQNGILIIKYIEQTKKACKDSPTYFRIYTQREMEQGKFKIIFQLSQ
jgi:hypothetical protein